MEQAADEGRVQRLQAEVESLQQKLHELHATDVNTLRRGYVTVAQHVDVLKLEATRLETLVNELEPELYPPEYIAEEVGKAAVLSGTVYGIFTLVKTITPLPDKTSKWIRTGLAAVTAIIVTWRFARSSIGRFAAALLDHKRRRKAFLKELGELQQRISMLHALTSSMPGIPRSVPSTAVRQASPTAATAESQSSGQTSGQIFGQTSGPTQQADQEQFLLLDLPRVDSGGFMLQSPTVTSPAPDTVLVGAPGLLSPIAASAGGGVVAGWGESSRGGTKQQLAAGLGKQQQQEHVSTAATETAGQKQQLSAAAKPFFSQQQHQQQQQTAGKPSAATLRQGQQQMASSAFVAPTSVLGWGGVVSQQELALHPQRQHQSAVTTAGRARELTPETDEGEWIDQPGVTAMSDDNNNGSNQGSKSSSPGRGAGSPERQQTGSTGQQQTERVSPTSSDEGVLLERE